MRLDILIFLFNMEVKHHVGDNPPLIDRVMIPLFATGYHPFGVHHVNRLIYEFVNISK